MSRDPVDRQAQKRLLTTRQVLRELDPETSKAYRRRVWQRRIRALRELFGLSV